MSAFTDFFSKVGHGLSSGLSAIGKPLMGAVSSLAPVAGTALGGMFGGPMGAMVGGGLGNAAGNLLGHFGGGGDAQQQPAQMPQMPSFQGMGQQFGGQAGNYLNQMLPPQYQGMNIGQLGQSFSSNMGNQLNNILPQSMQGLGLGQRAGAFLNNQLASRIPSAFQNQTLGGAGGLLGGQGGRYMAPMLRSRFGFAHGGGVHGLRDMADLLGHHYYDEGGEVYS